MMYMSDGGPKGHLTLKSSTLCPNGGKLTSQYLIVDQLVAHYKKLKKVKPHVDTSPPKAWLASQKVRDQVMRAALKDDSLRQEWFRGVTDRANVQQSSWRTSEFDRSDLVTRMQAPQLRSDVYNGLDDMALTGQQDKFGVDRHTAANRQLSGTTRLETAGKSRNSGQKYGEEFKNKSQIQKFETTKYASESDLIEIRKHMFTEGKPFTPRTLKTNMSSKLVQQGYYNPPKRRSRNPRVKAHKIENTVDGNTTKSLGDTTGLNDTLLTDTMRSYDGRARSMPSGVPLLNISQDMDNLRWLKEQSCISEAKQVQVTASAPAVLSETRKIVAAPGPQNQSVTQKRPLAARDEELLYLNFMKDVTNDILDRGIFTNRALKLVFESHVAKHKDELKLSKMQDMIKDLRTNLGIPDFDSPEDEGFGFNSSRKFTRSDFSPPRNLESNDSLPMTWQTLDPKQSRSGRRGSRGLNLNNRTALHDVLEVQEDDLSVGSNRTEELQKNRQRTAEGSDDDEASIADNTLRSEGNSTFGFDEFDTYLGKTQVINRGTLDQKQQSPKKVDLQSNLFEKGDGKKVGLGFEELKKEEESTVGGEAMFGRDSSARRKRRTPEHRPRKPLDQPSRSLTPLSSPERMVRHSPPGTDRSLELQVVMYEDGQQPHIQMLETDGKSSVPKSDNPRPTVKSPEPKTNSPIQNLNNTELGIENQNPKSNSPVPKVRSSQLKAKSPEPKRYDEQLHVEIVSSDSPELARSSLPEADTKFERKSSPQLSPEMYRDKPLGSTVKEEEEDTRTVENDGTGFDEDSSEFLDTLGAYKHSLEITDNFDDDFDEDEEEEADEKKYGVERSPRPSNPLGQTERMNDDF